MRLAYLLGLALSLLSALPALAAPTPVPCDSCDIRVESLDQPVKLAGTWLFTRDDTPQNKEVNLADAADWRLVKAPGPWKNVYSDGKNFPVGWYRGTFHFNPELNGREVVLLVNAFMGRVTVFVDGQEIYRRPNRINVETYYTNQPIPVRFTVSGPQHVVAIRVETPLMTGIYQLPFELRPYSPNDAGLVMYQVWGGELRAVVGWVVLMFGFFFLLVYAKTRYSLYLVAALCSIMIFPFFAAANDHLLRVVQPETLLYLQFVGFGAIFLFHLFSQHFHRFTPRFTWVLGSIHVALGLTIGAMSIWPNLDLFQALRSAMFAMNVFAGACSLYMLFRGMQNRRPGAGLLFAAMSVFLLAGCHDVLLALGVIQSLMMVPSAVMIFVGAMLYVASSSFANTFVENKHLVKDLKGLNDNLEQLVAQRTEQLRAKTQDINSMLQNMPQGVMTITEDNRVHPEYSAYLETIFETRDIAGRHAMEVLFAGSRLGADTLSQVETAAGSCVGQDRMNFDFNAHLMVRDLDKVMPDGRIKALELSWSPICDDADIVSKLMVCVRDVTALKQLEEEAGEQKRELAIIGEILAVSQEKFQDFMDSSSRFIEENRGILESTPDRLPEVINRLFRNMHTIKGNARTYGLMHLTHRVHETEQVYDGLRHSAEAPWQPGSLLDQLMALRATLDEYARINDNVLGRKGPGRRGSATKYLMVEKEQIEQSLQMLASVDQTDPLAMRGAINQAALSLNLLGTDRLDDVLAGTLDSLPSLARELGKEPPVIRIDDQGIAVRNQIHALLKNVFTHLLRNAIDHGLEPAAERLSHGKPLAGRIDIGLSLVDGRLRLCLRDDGRGIAIGKLRQRALAQQLLTPAQAGSAHTVAQTIFLAGFSTADQVTEVSGRGVGMEAVREFLKKEDGDIDVRFLDDRDTAFRPFELVIHLPAKYAARRNGLPDRRSTLDAASAAP